jgi:hypothetical protein
MPPLASAFAYEIDRAVERGYISPEPIVGGCWATLHALRPQEVISAFREGRGPMVGVMQHDATSLHGQTGTWIGLQGIASLCNASAGAFKLPTFPSA